MQVARLEEKLGILHATDTNALRRSHQSMRQHVQALAIEMKRLQACVSHLDGHSPEMSGDKCVREVCSFGLVHLMRRKYEGPPPRLAE